MPCTVGGLNGLRPGEIVGDYSAWASSYRTDVTLANNIVARDLSCGDRLFWKFKLRMEENAWLVVDRKHGFSPTFPLLT